MGGEEAGRPQTRWTWESKLIFKRMPLELFSEGKSLGEGAGRRRGRLVIQKQAGAGSLTASEGRLGRHRLWHGTSERA